MKMTHRLTALLLAFLMVVTCFPSTALSAFAAEVSPSEQAVIEEVKTEPKEVPPASEPAEEAKQEEEPSQQEQLPEEQPSENEEEQQPEEVKPEQKPEEVKPASGTDSKPAEEKEPEVKPEEGKTEEQPEEQLPAEEPVEETEPEVQKEDAEAKAAIAPALSAVRPKLFGALKADPPAETVLLTVYYIYEDGSPAADKSKIETKANESTAVPVPALEGFEAFYNGSKVETTFNTSVAKDSSINVIYKSKQIPYTVVHKVQQANGSYNSSDTETLYGKLGELTTAQPRTGYDSNWTITNPAPREIVNNMSEIVITYDRNRCYLNFESNGGTFITHKEGIYGGTVDISKQTNPTKKGYAFKGWYLDKELTKAATDNIVLANGDTTIYAKWAAGEANYTVVVWMEDATRSDPKKYDYYKTMTGSSWTFSGAVGTTTGITDKKAQTAITSSDGEKYTYWHYGHTVNTTIKEDGSTIVNVYYDRNVYHLAFYASSAITVKGVTYPGKGTSTSGDPTYTFDAVLNQDIADLWPYDVAPNSSGKLFDSWDNYYVTKRFTLTSELLGSKTNGSTTKFQAYYGASGTEVVEYWLQNADDNKYVKSDKYSQTIGEASGLSGKDIDGFTKVSTPSGYKGSGYDSDDLYHYRFYYSRKTYKLDMFNGGEFYDKKAIKTESSVKFEAKLSSYLTEATANAYKPKTVPSYYKFAGWYSTPDCLDGSEIDLSKATMPMANFAAYVKWAPIEVTLTYDLNYKVGTEDKHEEKILAGNAATTVPVSPEAPEGYYFDKWCADADLTTEFDLNTPITANTTIYPKYVPITETQYTVKFLRASDNSELFPSETYSGLIGADATATAKEAKSASAAADQELIVDSFDKKITLVYDKDHTKNIITFLYYDPSNLDIHYLVEYRYKGGENDGKLVDTTKNKAGKNSFYATTNHNTIVVDANDDYIPEGYYAQSPFIQKTLTIEETDAAVKKNILVFYVSADTYKIKYDLKGGTVSGTNPTTYTPETADFTLINPTKTNYVFKGWTGTDLSSATETVTVAKGSTGDREYVATWEGAPVTYVVHYYLTGTTTKLKEDKTDGCTGKFGETASEDAASIDGYTVDKDSKSITLAASGNEIIFYYTERDDIEYTVNYYLNGTTLKVQDSTTGDDATYNKEFVLKNIPSITGYTTVTTEAKIDKVALTDNVINIYYKKNLTITANNVEETYTGSPIGGDGAKVADAPNGLFKDDVFDSCTITGEQTDAGTYTEELVPSAAVIKRGGTALTDNEIAAQYVITYVKGDLKINAQNGVTVTITGHTDTVIYNGQEQSVTGYDFEVDDANKEIYTQNCFSCTNAAEAKGIKAGDYPMNLKESDFANISNNFTNVKFVVTDGKLTIKPKSKDDDTDGDGDVDGDDDPTKPNTGKEYQLSTESDSKVYDGKALTNSKYTLQGVLVDGDTIEVVVDGTQTEVGTSDNTIKSYKVVNGKGEDVTDCYVFLTPILGTLEVTKNTGVVVTITGNTDTVTYDGKEHKVEGYKVKIDDPENAYSSSDFTFKKEKAEATGTYAGTYPMELSKSDFENKNTNFDNVTFIVKDGSLTINPKTKDDDTDGDGDVDGDDDPSKPNSGKEYQLTAGSDQKAYDGKELTNHTYTKQGVLVEGDKIVDEDVVYEGSQTEVGSSANKIKSFKIINASGVDVTNCYTFLDSVDGTLKVTPNSEVIVYITGKTDTVTYDGKKHEVTGYEVSISDATGTYTEKDIDFSGSAKASGTLADTYPMNLSASDFANNNENFSNVTFKVTDGQLVIEPKTKDDDTNKDGEVTNDEEGSNNGNEYQLTAKSDNKVYDGKPLTLNDYELQGVLVKGDTIQVTVDGSQTEVGESANKVKSYKIVNVSGSDVTSCYVFKDSVDGKLTVTPLDAVVVKITGHKDTVVYNGKEQSVTGYDVDLGEYEGLYSTSDIKFTGTAEAKGTLASDDPYPMNLSDSDFSNTNKNFENVIFLVTDGSLTITPKQKDGDTDDDGDVDEDDDPNDPNGGNEYQLTADSDEKVYDGTPLTKHSYTKQGVLIEGDKIDEASIVYEGSQTDVGSSANKIKSFKIVNGKGEDVTGCYVFKNSIDGTLTVTPLTTVKVTIKGHTDTVTYDGTKHEVTGYDVSITDATGTYTEEDIDFSGSAKASGTLADTYPMNLSTSDFSNNNKNFENVTFEVIDGSLTINPKEKDGDTDDDGDVDEDDDPEDPNGGNEYQLTADSDEKVYDGTPLTKHSYTAKGVLVKGDSITDVVYEGSQTEAGSSPNKITSFKIVNGAGEDVTSCYVFKDSIDGTLTVTSNTDIVVTIIGHKDTVTYDGKTHTVTGYDVSMSDTLYTVEDFTFSGTDTVTKKLAGEYPMGLSASDFTNTNPNFANVTFKVTDGGLTIDPRKKDGDKDGDGDIDEDDEKIDGDGESKEYQLTADSAEKPYDGTPLTKDSYTKQGVLIAGDSITVVVEGSQTDIGSSPNKIKSYVITNKEGEDVTSCYVFKDSIDGTLKVTSYDTVVVIETATDEKDFDGTALKADKFEVKEGVLAPGDTFVPVYGSGRTNVGSTENSVSYVIENASGTDVTIKYTNLTVNFGVITINPADLIVTLGSAQKVYDGTPLSCSDFEASPSDLAAGYGLEVVMNDTLTDVGEITMEDYSVTVKAPRLLRAAPMLFSKNNAASAPKAMPLLGAPANQDVPTPDNYRLKVIPGTLKVTPLEIEITAGSDEKYYDGTALVCNEWSQTDGELAKGQTIDSVKVTGSQTEVGKSANVASDAVILDSKGNNVAKNYKITYVDGLLTVKQQLKITITAGSDTKTYDGKPLTCDKWEMTDGVLSDGDYIESVTVTGSQTEPGVAKNVASNAVIRDAQGNDVTAKYEIVYIDGILTVTASPKTGDTNNYALLMTIMLTSWFAMALLWRTRKKDENEV